jgi:hypothetical protein
MSRFIHHPIPDGAVHVVESPDLEVPEKGTPIIDEYRYYFDPDAKPIGSAHEGDAKFFKVPATLLRVLRVSEARDGYWIGGQVAEGAQESYPIPTSDGVLWIRPGQYFALQEHRGAADGQQKVHALGGGYWSRVNPRTPAQNRLNERGEMDPDAKIMAKKVPKDQSTQTEA